MNNAIFSFLEENAKKIPDKAALVHGATRLTYRKLNQAVNQCAHALDDRGIRKGDAVVISTHNKLFEVVYCYGILKMGGIEVAVDPQNFEHAIAPIMKISGTQTVICDQGDRQIPGSIICSGDFLNSQRRENPAVEVGRSDRALIQFTSGSTGNPKGVMLTHGNFIPALSENGYIQRLRGYTVFLPMPLSYAYGKSILLEYLSAGATVCLPDKKMLPGDVFLFLKQNRISALEGPPSLYEMLLRLSGFKREPLHNLGYISIGGGAATQRLVSSLQQAQPQAIVSNRYGLTETASAVTRINFFPGSSTVKSGSCGKAVSYADIKIVDRNLKHLRDDEMGEIFVKGSNVALGYIDENSMIVSELHDGWLQTGDYGKKDKDGYLYIFSRTSQIIKSQGYRISPIAIEDMLMKIPEIKYAAVLGEPHELHEETVKAYIETNADLTEEKIISFCRKNLPPFMIPQSIQFIHEMPLTASGKINKSLLQNKLKT